MWIEGIAVMAFFVSILAAPLTIVTGVKTYPTLIGKLQAIEVLEQQGADPSVIAMAKAEYKFLLAKARYYKRNPIYLVFGHGFFISDKVFQLPIIGSK